MLIQEVVLWSERIRPFTMIKFAHPNSVEICFQSKKCECGHALCQKTTAVLSCSFSNEENWELCEIFYCFSHVKSLEGTVVATERQYSRLPSYSRLWRLKVRFRNPLFHQQKVLGQNLKNVTTQNWLIKTDRSFRNSPIEESTMKVLFPSTPQVHLPMLEVVQTC